MTGQDCISLLKEMKTKQFEDDEDKTRMLYNIKLAVTSLCNGKPVFQQTEEYVNAGEYNKAMKCVRKAFRKDRFWIFNKLRSHRVFSIIIFPILMLISSVILLFIGYNLTRMGKESVNWPKTTGLIEQSFYTKDVDEDGDVTFEPFTEYSYSVFDKEYKSEKRNIGGYTGFEEEHVADLIVRKYPKGSLVTVWYNPKKHSFAVLEPGFDSKFHFTVYMAYAILGISILFMCGILIAPITEIVREGKGTD